MPDRWCGQFPRQRPQNRITVNAARPCRREASGRAAATVPGAPIKQALHRPRRPTTAEYECLAADPATAVLPTDLPLSLPIRRSVLVMDRSSGHLQLIRSAEKFRQAEATLREVPQPPIHHAQKTFARPLHPKRRTFADCELRTVNFPLNTLQKSGSTRVLDSDARGSRSSVPRAVTSTVRLSSKRGVRTRYYTCLILSVLARSHGTMMCPLDRGQWLPMFTWETAMLDATCSVILSSLTAACRATAAQFDHHHGPVRRR